MTDIYKPVTFNKVDGDETGLQRSLSLPASRRKNRRAFMFLPGNNVSPAQHDESEKVQESSSSKSHFANRSSRGFRSSRKADIRVSKFEPMGINIPEEMMVKIRNVEERSLVDAVRASNVANGKSQFHNGACSHSSSRDVGNSNRLDKMKRKGQGNINSLKKILQGGARRIGSKSGSHDAASCCCVIKTVEIVRHPEENLGIFIKKRKVSLETETAMLSSHDQHKLNSSNSRDGIFISRLSTNCSAAKQALIQPGDEILAVNTVHISSLDVQMVATMMCMLKRIILTVRSLQSKQSNGSTQTDFSRKQKTAKSSMVSLPEGVELTDKNESVLAVTYSARNGNVKNSVYDNDFNQQISTEETAKHESENLVQTQFDESYQILLDAIAGLEKPKSTKTSKSSSDKLSTVPTENTQTNKLDDKVVETSDSTSLLSEILDRVDGGQNWKSYLSDQGSHEASNHRSKDANVIITPSSSHYCTSDRLNAKDFNENLCEPEYDEVAFSDNEIVSSSSSTQEVNLDDFDKTINFVKLQDKTSDLASASSSSSSISGGIRSADHVLASDKVFHRPSKSDDVTCGGNKMTKPHSSDSDMQHHHTKGLLTYSNEKLLDSSTYGRETPKFPVGILDAPPSVVNMGNPLLTTACAHSGSITVDKKRGWLNSGQVVSDELKKRLDGSNGDKFQTHAASGDVESRQWFSQGKLNRSMSNESGTSPPMPRSVSNKSLESYKSGNECSVKRKASLRSPIEKCAKSLLSVSSPTNPSFQPAFSYDNKASSSDNILSANQEKLPEAGGLNNSPVEIAVNEHGHCKDDNDRTQKPVVIGKNKPTLEKSSSPSRPRKKTNWSRKFTRKFKNIGSSENAGSEYSCWTTEDLGHSSNPPVLDPSLSKKVINRGDSTVLNRYHLDISMAHQRRLSRQLFLDNRGRESAHRALSLSQFQKYKPLPVIDSQFLLPVDGCLVITLYGVRELKKTLCESYCIVQVDEEATKRIGTTMQTCKGSTTWNQCFEMVVNQAKNLQLTVYTWDTRGGKHKAASHSTISLSVLVQGAKSRYRYSERLAVSLYPRGTLYIKIALERSSSSSQGPLLFGADLQSIADREGSGELVPPLVRSCIEQVEQRGMHVVGIYRLCGSAIVKKDLRRKLEESNGKVDLTSSNYPDVNVITGILKDFLRELPQPLFPPELLEAVTKVMALNPGPSPATVVKDAFAPDLSFGAQRASVTSQVPDSEQRQRTEALLRHIERLRAAPADHATLYALMNHLKKVALNSNHNKMICQNLAVCFGPVLLGPVNTGPANSMDLDAAIGFKRHIQVLNYMICNWPAQSVHYQAPQPITKNDAVTSSTKDLHRVSLTRRLSRVYVDDDDVIDDDEGSHRVSLASIQEGVTPFTDPDLDMYIPGTSPTKGAAK